MPMAVPLTWRKCQELKEKLFWVRINCESWRRNQADGWVWVRVLVQEMFQGREAMGMEAVGV